MAVAIKHRKNIAKVLNDLEKINERDVFRYTKGHLSVKANRATAANVADILRTQKPLTDEQQHGETNVRHSLSKKISSDGPSVAVPGESTTLSKLLRKSYEEKPIRPVSVESIHLQQPVVPFPGVTKAEQMEKFVDMAKSAQFLIKSDLAVQHLRTTEQELRQQLQRFGSADMNEPVDQFKLLLLRVNAAQSAFQSVVDQAAAFKPILSAIKEEYDRYARHLIDKHDYQTEALNKQLNRIANSDDLKRLRQLEDSVVQLGKDVSGLRKENADLSEQILKKRLELDSIVPPTLDPRASKCRPEIQPLPSQQVQSLRVAIAEREAKLSQAICDIRKNYIPIGQLTVLSRTAADVQTEVNSLAAGCRMLDRKKIQLDSELTEMLRGVDMSARDAKLLDDVTGKSADGGALVLADMSEDPFELIGKIEAGLLPLLDPVIFEERNSHRPWEVYIS